MNACAVNWILVLEFAKVLLTWPVLGTIGLTALVLAFRTEIRALLPRLKGAKFPGGSVELADAQQKSEGVAPPPIEALPAPTTANAAALVVPAPILPFEARIGVLALKPPNVEPIDYMAVDPARAKLEILYWWRVAKFESILNLIFGSQLAAVRHLQGVGQFGEALDGMQPFYAMHVQRAASGVALPSISAWLEFIQRQQVVHYADDGRLRITDYGRAFLEHVVATYTIRVFDQRGL